MRSREDKLDRWRFLTGAGGMVGASVGLAGCSGGDGEPTSTTDIAAARGTSGDGAGGNGSGGGSGSGSDGSGSVGGASDGTLPSVGSFEAFTRTGEYTYAVDGGESPEKGISGTTVFDIETVTAESVTINLEYDLEIAPGEVEQGVGGSYQGELSASGPKDTVVFQLSQFPGGSIIVFAFYPIYYAAGQSLVSGAEWTGAGPARNR